MQENMIKKETEQERTERYETAFLEYLDEYDACGISIDDWAKEHGLSLELLSRTGSGCGFSIPKGVSIQKQREDFSSSFESISPETEIMPVIRKEKAKATARKEKPMKKESKIEPEQPVKRKGRPRKDTAATEASEKKRRENPAHIAGKETMQPSIPPAPDFISCLENASIIRKGDVLFLVTDSDEKMEMLQDNIGRVREIIQETEGFSGRIELLANYPEELEKETAEEETMQEQNDKEVKEMPKMNDGKKPSFLLMDGKAVLEDEGFHMELAIDMTDAEDIKKKIDLLYSSLDGFRKMIE